MRKKLEPTDKTSDTLQKMHPIGHFKGFHDRKDDMNGGRTGMHHRLDAPRAVAGIGVSGASVQPAAFARIVV